MKPKKQDRKFEDVWAEIQSERPYPEEIDQEEEWYQRDLKKIQRDRYYMDDLNRCCYDGFFAEEYIYTAFRYGKTTYFGEVFDEIHYDLNSWDNDVRFSLTLINDKSVLIITAFSHPYEDLIKIILKLPDLFRERFPEEKNHRIFLGLAAQEFTPEIEKLCIENGIAIFKQVRDVVVVEDKNLIEY